MFGMAWVFYAPEKDITSQCQRRIAKTAAT
jgi:hypothetical protein